MEEKRSKIPLSPAFYLFISTTFKTEGGGGWKVEVVVVCDRVSIDPGSND